MFQMDLHLLLDLVSIELVLVNAEVYTSELLVQRAGGGVLEVAGVCVAERVSGGQRSCCAEVVLLGF